MARPSPLPPLLLLLLLAPLVHSQQPYSGISINDCSNSDNSTSVLGYFCTPKSPSCLSYLTFHSQSPYTNVSSISSLLSTDPSQLSNANAVSQSATFPTNTKVLVPVNCSCTTAGYYQTNTYYIVQPDDTPFIIANSTFQGLTTCQAIRAQNKPSFSSGYLRAGDRITIPLRCACPSTKQRNDAVKFLLTYLVDPGDNIFLIRTPFGVTQQSFIDANELTSTLIYPFTTLLVPLQNEPNSSQLAAPLSPSSSPPSQSSGTNSNNSGLYAVIGVALAVMVLIIAGISVYCVYIKPNTKKKIKGKKVAQLEDSIGNYEHASKALESKVLEEISNKEMVSRVSEISHTLRMYKIKELQLATENFSYKCMIAGSVYRGDFNGDVCAVKMMSRDVSSEIELLKRISHSNLISLCGVCFDQGRWYLVYEYAHNGSLQSWLFDTSGLLVLSWVQRMQIALDVANGLNYLHRFTKPAYVHMDVNSSNVLLDGKFRAKISNFGNARLAEEKEGELALTRHIVGTIGYMAPEYLEHGFVSPMLDVYAFGAVMMEIMTARGVADHRSKIEDFIAMIREEDAREKLGGYMDPLLGENYPVDLALVMAQLIGGCLKLDAWSRPSMEEITQSLSRIFAASQIWEASKSTGLEPVSCSSEMEPLKENVA